MPTADSDVQRVRAALGDAVRRLRLERGWTQKELAHHAGFDRKSINRVENAAYSPTVDRIVMLARALDVSAADLLDDRARTRKHTDPKDSA